MPNYWQQSKSDRRNVENHLSRFYRKSRKKTPRWCNLRKILVRNGHRSAQTKRSFPKGNLVVGVANGMRSVYEPCVAEQSK